MIYIDPPFDSKADYKKKITLKGQEVKNDQSAFEEKQYTDIWSNDEYLQFMYERLILLKELLSEKGSIYLHCDSKKSHHLRCIMDEVFGQEYFLNDIIWCYSDAANSKKYWNTKHDTILFYGKSSDRVFNFEKVLRDHTEENIKKYKYEDEKGRYRLFGKNIQGSPIQWHRDVSPEWEKTNPELVFRHYLKEGSLPLDWWLINPVNQAAKERQSYPTQKPEKLIEPMILASSNSGDIVFDCFMGSGTAQTVALKLGRRFIGADINLGAIQTTTKRLLKVSEELNKNTKQAKLDEEQPTYYTGFEVYNVNHYDVFRNPIQAKDLLIQALEIQPISNSIYDGEKDGRMVKLMPVNHIATKEDVADLINGVDYKTFEKRKADNPNQPVEKIRIVCMGHEPDLKAYIQQSIGYKLDIEIVDILRDRADLQFKREAEAEISTENNQLTIEQFYPMNLMQKLSLMEENVTDWREMVESVMIDWNYDGAVFQPTLIDVPDKNELVSGSYAIPEDAGNIRVKITDLLSESLEQTISVEGE